MPSNEKNLSRKPMWTGVKVAYLIVALCLFPLAIAGYWAYGHKVIRCMLNISSYANYKDIATDYLYVNFFLKK